MVAMKAATDNGGSLIKELQLVYNKARQASITQEQMCIRDSCTATVCYTIRDEHAYATTAQKRFYYTHVTSSGHVWLDTTNMPAGTRLTFYLITDRGQMVTAGLTL